MAAAAQAPPTPGGGTGTGTGIYTYAQLKGIWLAASTGTRYHSATWATLMAAIAMAESGGNANAQNDQDNGGTQSSFGLWQISTGTHTPPAQNWADPAENAHLAIGKLDGQGLTAWGTYDSGAYKAYLNSRTTPDPNIPGNPGALGAQGAASGVADCLLANPFSGSVGPIGFSAGPACLFSKSNARAFIGAGLMAAGALIAFPGLLQLAAGAGLAAARPALDAVGQVPVAGRYARAATAAAGGRAAKAGRAAGQRVSGETAAREREAGRKRAERTGQLIERQRVTAERKAERQRAAAERKAAQQAPARGRHASERERRRGTGGRHRAPETA